MSYEIEYHPKAQKGFLALPAKAQRRLAQVIDALAENPRPVGCKKLGGKLADLYRVRSGNYRVVYQLKDKKLIIYLLRIGKRGDIYKLIS